MVRGRPYIHGDGIRIWRSSSVPVDDLRSPVDVNVLHKAHMIKTNAVQDADAIKAASKRHDINFLNDISNKLAVATQPRPYFRESTPAYVGSRYSTPAPITSEFRRRSYAPPVSDYEVTNYLAGGPLPYRRHYRGASVPPVNSTPVVPRYNPVPIRSVSRTPVYSVGKVSPYDDVVLGVARTSRYGDVVIGVPYNKRHTLQPQSNGVNSYSLYSPSRYVPSSARTVVQPTYRRASLATVPAYKSLYDDVDEILSTPVRHRVNSSRRYHDADLDLDWPSARPLSTLKGRAQSVQRQLDGIPEFQVYTPSRPRAASTVPTYSSTPAPSASSYTGGSAAPVPSYSTLPSSAGSSASSKAPPKQVGRQPVSEARRKVRDLLCKSKNDPRYYDGF